MNADDGKNKMSLIPRPPSAVEKAEPGAKRVLALMVSDTLAIAEKHLTPVCAGPTQAELDNWYQQGLEQYHRGAFRAAAEWYRKAAEQGHALAQIHLGICHELGYGVPQDYTETVKWFRKAAEQGIASAYYGMGHCYHLGYGVSQDYEEALTWYCKAAEHGHAEAQHQMGVCYRHRTGVKAER